jgi:hypothetical protein
MKRQLMVLSILLTLMIPAGALAMKHGSSDKMGHESMSGMDMGGEMIMLQGQEVDGVMASAHLMDVKAKMAEHGMNMTHHIMVSFMNSDGNEITDGQVALKVKAPDGNVSKATKMMNMSGQFGVDINLDQKGKYQLIIGTKLADGQKRTFQFDYEN